MIDSPNKNFESSLLALPENTRPIHLLTIFCDKSPRSFFTIMTEILNHTEDHLILVSLVYLVIKVHLAFTFQSALGSWQLGAGDLP